MIRRHAWLQRRYHRQRRQHFLGTVDVVSALAPAYAQAALIALLQTVPAKPEHAAAVVALVVLLAKAGKVKHIHNCGVC